MISDKSRLAALASYGIIGSATDSLFDDLAKIAAQLCASSGAFVAFVSGDTQFFKASADPAIPREADLESGFCSLTVARQDVLLIPDTLADARYARNRVVVETPSVRSYFGVPLRSPEGYVLGAICVFDQVPREITDSQLDALRGLGRQVEALLALRRVVSEQDSSRERLEESEQRFRALADHMAQFAWMADNAGWIFWYNRRWFDYTGTTLEEMQGWGWKKVHHPDYCDKVEAKFRTHLTSGDPWEDTFPLRGADGAYRWFLSRAHPTRDESGSVALWCGTNTDVTEQRSIEEALRASEATLKEREQRLRTLYELTARTDLDFPEKVKRLLGIVRTSLGMDGGALALTDCVHGTYAVVQIDTNGDTVPIGFTCPLDDTFCSEVVKRGPEKPPLAFENASAITAWRDHPAYRAFGSEAYLAAMVRVGGKIWGTLSFFARTPRLQPFTDFDKDVVRLMAQWVGGEIEQQQSQTALASSIERQRRFLRDMVSSMTEGRLQMCLSDDDLPAHLPEEMGAATLTVPTLRAFRKRLEHTMKTMGFASERAQDLETAVGEASMNAATHGGGGEGRIAVDPATGRIQVWITDGGSGIAEDALPKVLEKGVSTAGSLGHGFWLMLRTCDRIYLLTGPEGTTLVLEQNRTPPEPAWLSAFTN